MSPDHTDRNLIFGVLALQADLLDAARFAEACAAWAARKDTPLADLLVARGWITPQDRTALERRVELGKGDYPWDVPTHIGAGTAAELALAPVGLDSPGGQPSSERPTRPGEDPPPATAAYRPEGHARYAPTRLHARGGIGQIWLARDADLGRDVALKELRPEVAASPGVRARFLEEAKITGQLEHPGVVPVYELVRGPAGGPGDPQPFYAMRFLQGRTLTDAVRAYHRKLAAGAAGPMDLRDLLNAFVAVCNTVAYAHAKGVLHRDLKGRNVLLGDFGEVMVLDWGLAKKMGGYEDPSSASPLSAHPAPPAEPGQTLEGQVLGTPGYMSPEQARGRLDLIGPRSDVYGLGAILHEILTGEPPFSGTGSREVLRKVTHEPPTPTQARVAETPRALQAVCLKALAKEPADRYASAGELAGEIQRFLADEPVTACREPVAARLARWERRHKPLVAGAAALLVAAVVGLTAGTVLLNRANARTEEQRQRAEENFQQAQEQGRRAEAGFRQARQAVDDYLTTVSESTLLTSPLPGLQPLRKELLESALKYYQAFLDEHGDDPALQADLAAAYFRVGRIRSEIGSNRDALNFLQEARGRYEALVATGRDEPRIRYELARCHLWVGGLHYRLSQLTEAEASYRQAAEILCRLRREHPDNLEFDELYARVLFVTGQLQRRTSHHPEAIRSFEEALEVQRRLVDADPARARYRSAVASTCMSLGFLYVASERADKALPLHEHARETLEQLTRDHPGVTEYWNELARAHINLGYLNESPALSKFDEALKEYERSLAIRKKLANENPSVPDFQRTVGGMYNQIGALQAKLGRRAEAAATYREGIDLFERVRRDRPEDKLLLEGLGTSYRVLGSLQLETGAVSDAEQSFRNALDALEPVARKNPADYQVQHGLITARRGTGAVQARTDRLDEALRTYQEASPVLRELVGKNPSYTNAKVTLGNNHQDLGDVQRRLKQTAEAERSFREALKVREELVKAFPKMPDYKSALGHTLHSLAGVALERGEPHAARPLAERALPLQQAAWEANRQHPDYRRRLADNRALLAEVLLRQQEHTGAVRSAEEMAKLFPDRAEDQYRAAAFLARCVPLARQDAALPEPNRKELAQSYGDRAVQLLHQAVRQGYGTRKGVEHLKADKALDPIRERPDFKQLITDLEK